MKNPFKKKEEPKPEPEQPTKVMESDFIMNEEKTESKQEKAEAKAEAAKPEETLQMKYAKEFQEQFAGATVPEQRSSIANDLLFAIYCELKKLNER